MEKRVSQLFWGDLNKTMTQNINSAEGILNKYINIYKYIRVELTVFYFFDCDIRNNYCIGAGKCCT